MAEERRQHAAALSQQKQHEASQAQLLEDKGARIAELQQQLAAAQATAADARKQKDDAVALQITTRDQLNALNSSHKVGAWGAQHSAACALRRGARALRRPPTSSNSSRQQQARRSRCAAAARLHSVTQPQALLQERDTLASQVAKLREDADALKSAAEAHKSQARAVAAAYAQAQAVMQTLGNAVAPLSTS